MLKLKFKMYENITMDLNRNKVTAAADDAAEKLQVAMDSNKFSKADVEAATALVEAQKLAAAQQRELAELLEADSGADKTSMEANLVALNAAVADTLTNVHKAKRRKLLDDRQKTLSSPKRVARKSEGPASSHDATSTERVARNSEQQVSSHDASQRDSGTQSTDLEQSQPDESSLRRLLDGMQQDVPVLVKLFYTPHEISRPTSRHNKTELELYEAKVGANGIECALIATNNAATKALDLLKPHSGEVLKIWHTKHSEQKGEAQLSLMDNFEVEVVTEGHTTLRKQALQRISIAQLPKQTDKARISLITCAVVLDSECKDDKNGNPYRQTRLVDAHGNVTYAMVWGDLAAKEDVWDRNCVLDVSAVSVNVEDTRIDLRNFSQVSVSPHAATFKMPSRLNFGALD